MSAFDGFQARKKEGLYDADTYMIESITNSHAEDKCPIGDMLSMSGNSITITMNHIYLFNGIKKMPFSAVVKGGKLCAKRKKN
jgi:hypothetical protein